MKLPEIFWGSFLFWVGTFFGTMGVYFGAFFKTEKG